METARGCFVTYEIFLCIFSLPLLSTDVSVPLLLVGDADAYDLPNLPSFVRLTAEGEERNATATLTSNRNADADSILVSIECLEDADRFDDIVTVTVDDDNLPLDFILGDKPSWRVEIPDDQLSKVS